MTYQPDPTQPAGEGFCEALTSAGTRCAQPASETRSQWNVCKIHFKASAAGFRPARDEIKVLKARKV